MCTPVTRSLCVASPPLSPHPGLLSRPLDLDDRALVEAALALVRRERGVLAEVLAHLMVIDERRLWAPEGYGSFFDYCRAGLGYSEAEAYRRSQAARLCRRVPTVLNAIDAGRLHLSAVCALAPHLTNENADELMRRAAGLSKRELEGLLAARSAVTSPLPGEVGRVVEVQAALDLGGGGSGLPERHSVPGGPSRDALGVETLSSAPPGCGAGLAAHVGDGAAGSATALGVAARPSSASGYGVGLVAAGGEVGGVSAPGIGATAPRPARVVEQRISVRATPRLVDALERARALMGHHPGGNDPATVLERALELLVNQLERQRFGAPGRRSSSVAAAKGTNRRTKGSVACGASTDQGSDVLAADGGDLAATADGGALALAAARGGLAATADGGAEALATGCSAPASTADGGTQALAADVGGEASASDCGVRAPASGADGRAPASGADGRAPASGAAGRAPASGGDGRAPASGGDGRAPASGGGGRAPASGGGAQALAADGGGRAPASGGGGRAPASGGGGGASAAGGGGRAPASGGGGASASRRTRGAIPAWVRRTVFERDQGRCTFVGRTGHVCGSRDRTELHHRVPWAHGGEHSVENLTLHCRRHNVLQAELDGLGVTEARRGQRTTASAR